MADRCLVSIIRELPASRLPTYEGAWSTLEAAVTATGAHAWRFRSDTRPDRFIEFLEFGAGQDPRDLPDITAHLAALERVAPGLTEEWLDASNPLENW